MMISTKGHAVCSQNHKTGGWGDSSVIECMLCVCQTGKAYLMTAILVGLTDPCEITKGLYGCGCEGTSRSTGH